MLALEVGVRAIGEKPFSGGNVERHDETLGWVPAENALLNGYWNRSIHTLSDGIRSNGNATVWSGLQQNQILAVGDSFTFGDQVDDGQTWPAFLERNLKRGVGNGGVSGYGLDQIYLRSETLSRKYHPQILIVSFIADDIRRTQFSEMWGLWKPYFWMNELGELEIKNSPVPATPVKQEKNSWQRLLQKSVLANMVFSRLAPGFWFETLGYHVMQGHREGVRVSCELMRKFATLQGPGTRVLVVLQSSDAELSPSADALEVLGCAKRNKLTTLDLNPAFESLKKSNFSRFKTFWNWHLTPEGNRFVADQITAFLKGWVGG